MSRFTWSKISIYGLLTLAPFTSSQLFPRQVFPPKTNSIVSGALWRDTDGAPIQAHGGGVIKTQEGWYWFGEDKTGNKHTFVGISCYFSRDLINWQRRKNVLSPVEGTELNEKMVVERPKVVYNQLTKTFVMYFHYDDKKWVIVSVVVFFLQGVLGRLLKLVNYCTLDSYKVAKVGVATSQSVDSDWKFIKTYSPLNSQSRDMSIFQDDDGIAFLSFASDSNANLKIARLSEDYMDTVELTYIWNKVFWEATGIIKHKGVYTMLYSKQDGWNPNPNSAIQATDLRGPWSQPQFITPKETKTFFSQNAFDLAVQGTETTSFIYMGDRWNPKALGRSTYIWLPLRIEGAQVTLEWADIWRVDAHTGQVTIADGDSYPISSAVVKKDQITFNGIIGEGPDDSFQYSSIYYSSTGRDMRSIKVSTNGGHAISVDLPPSSAIISVPMILKLKQGPNKLDIMIPHGGYKVQKIVVYRKTPNDESIELSKYGTRAPSAGQP